MKLSGLFETISAPVVTIGASEIAHLKNMAAASDQGRFRLCVHEDTNHPMQEMFICAKRHSYLVPHKHPEGRSESYFLLEGEADVYILSEDGQVLQKISLSAIDAEKPRFFRISEPLIHFVFPLTDWLIYHEVFTGPWVKDEVVLVPQFAPDETDIAAVYGFIRTITGVSLFEGAT